MEIRTGSLKAAYDEKRGAFVSLQSKEGQEFLLTPEEFPEYDVPEARWLGNLFLAVEKDGRTETMNTGASGDIRRIGYEKGAICANYCQDSRNPNGIRNLHVRQTFRADGEGIRWDIQLANPSETELRVRKLGIPLLMNQYFRGSNRQKYEKCVLRHTCIVHHHSYLYWSKSSGNMPILFLQAVENTPLVHFSCEKRDPVFGRRSTMGEAFEGCFYVYPVHEEDPHSHMPGNVLCLQPGEKETFCFSLGMTQSYEEMEARLVQNGGMAVKALPGMCVPMAEDVYLLIQSHRKPDVSCVDEGDICREFMKKGAAWVARIRFGGYGIRNLRVHSGKTVMKLRFFALESIGEIIRKQAAFMTDKQFETDPSDPCYHGLLMWDMTLRQRINASCNPNGPNWFAGGSDEIGLASGLFLSAKNVYLPEEGQIKVLDAYIRDFLERRLTEQPGYRVHRMVPWFQMFEPWAGHGADDAWRAFNYVHVINTFCNMYEIAARYRYDFLESPAYYADQAHHYMKAMFSHWMFPNGLGALEYANMGESRMALTLGDILEKEGMPEKAEWVRNTIRSKGEYFAGQEYPYGSEMAYDSTAFEAVYAYGKAIGNKHVMEMAMKAARANRGRQPVWYLYQTDLRQMGDSSWNVSYMTQLGAYPIYDWLFEQQREINGSEHMDDKAQLALTEAWYGSYLAGWSLFNSGGFWSMDPENRGASGWIVDGDMGECSGMEEGHSPYIKGLVPMSGESALGYYGALQIAACAIVEHPVLGRYGFGCRLEEENGQECIIPTDGLGIRIHHLADHWSLEIDRDSIGKAVRDGDGLRISIHNLTGDAHMLRARFRHGLLEEQKQVEISAGKDFCLFLRET